MGTTTSTWNEALVRRDAIGRFDEFVAQGLREELGQEADRLDGAGAMLRERGEVLKAGGYVPAVATRAVTAAATTSRRDDWWETSRASAEYGDQTTATHLKMPDDYTPGGYAGRSLDGSLRTYRRRYEVGGMTLRMPSKAAVNRFSAEHHDATFDVPLSADIDGRSIAGHVRLTRSGPGRWHAEALGFPEHSADMLSEAVMANLEARSASRTPRTVADLLLRRQEREASYGTDVNESAHDTWIHSSGYNAAAGLMVAALRGKPYGYEVDGGTYEQFSASESRGSFYARNIKGSGNVAIDRCDDCGRFSATGTAHICPPSHKAAAGSQQHYNQAARERAALVSSGWAAGRQITPVVPAESVREVVADAAPAVREPEAVAHQPEPAPAPVAPAPAPAVAAPAAAAPAPAPAREVREFDTDAFLTHERTGSEALRGAQRQYGGVGWTTQPVREVLSLYMSSRHVPGAYRSDYTNGSGEFAAFAGLGGGDARQILSTATNASLRARAADGAPSTGAFLRAAASHPEVEVAGFAVPPSRADERIAVDEALIHRPDLATEEDVLREAFTTYRLDMTSRPKRIAKVKVPWREGSDTAWRLYW